MIKVRSRAVVILAAVCFLISMTLPAFASLPDLDIEASDQSVAGTAVPILLEIEHKDSSPYHYVDDVRLYEVKLNESDRLLKEWKFNSTNYVPRDSWFLIGGEFVFNKNAFLRADAHCTVHGWSEAGRCNICTLIIYEVPAARAVKCDYRA